MKSVLLFSLLIGLGGFSVKAQYTLAIEVSGVKYARGKIGLCLLTDENEFLSDCSDYAEMAVTSRSFTFRKEGVKPGTYAVTIYHDVNDNGQLDTNFLGIPKERYGFSNNPGSRFGPPSYEKCLFEIRGDTTISIRLK